MPVNPVYKEDAEANGAALDRFVAAFAAHHGFNPDHISLVPVSHSLSVGSESHQRIRFHPNQYHDWSSRDNENDILKCNDGKLASIHMEKLLDSMAPGIVGFIGGQMRNGIEVLLPGNFSQEIDALTERLSRSGNVARIVDAGPTTPGSRMDRSVVSDEGPAL